jgi:hypothetical protein
LQPLSLGTSNTMGMVTRERARLRSTSFRYRVEHESDHRKQRHLPRPT